MKNEEGENFVRSSVGGALSLMNNEGDPAYRALMLSITFSQILGASGYRVLPVSRFNIIPSNRSGLGDHSLSISNHGHGERYH